MGTTVATRPVRIPHPYTDFSVFADLAEGRGLEPPRPCGHRFSRAAPYQFGTPFQAEKL